MDSNIDMPLHRSWQPAIFSSSEYDAITAIIQDIGRRLQDHNNVLKMAQIASQQSKYHIWALHGYRSQSLASGPLGLALFYNELDRAFPREGWYQTAQMYMSLLPDRSIFEGKYAFGLFSGLCGVLFTAHQLVRGNDQYAQLCNRLSSSVHSVAGKYNTANNQLDPIIYNLTSGAVGIGATLLQCVTSGSGQTSLQEVQIQSLAYLSQLVQHLAWLGLHYNEDSQTIDNLYKTEESAFSGYGLRQGIAGLISLLSLICISDIGVKTNHALEALEKLSKQVKQGLSKHDGRWHYSQSKRRDEYHPTELYSVYGWCDGTSGTARALQLASRALNDNALSMLALELIDDVGQHAQKMAAKIGPSLCHGLAGIIQICAHFANETREPVLQEHVRTLANQLLVLFELDRPFGYRALEPEYIRVDSPWLMDGAAGIAITLLAVIGQHTPTWDRILLIH